MSERRYRSYRYKNVLTGETGKLDFNTENIRIVGSMSEYAALKRVNDINQVVIHSWSKVTPFIYYLDEEDAL
jgi:pantothenate kinase